MFLNKTIAIACSIAMLNVPLFFSFMGLIGIEYGGSKSSSIYVGYIILIAFFSFSNYLYATLKVGLVKNELFIILCIFSLFFNHFLWVFFDELGTPLLPEFLIFFLLFGLPGFFSALTVIKLNYSVYFIKFTELLFVMIGLGIVVFSIIPTLLGSRVASIGGGTYQALSYYSSFCFGMLLIYNAYIPSNFRFQFMSSIFIRGLSYFLILACVIGTLVGGGRGALILSFFYMLLVVFSVLSKVFNNLTRQQLLDLLMKFIFLILMLLIFSNVFWERDFIQSGFTRATQFISAGGSIDLEGGSSGRLPIYEAALSYIAERPLLGYGAFAFQLQTIQAHNIFLELILQFGFVGLFSIIFLFFIFAFRVAKGWDIFKYWALGLLLYPAIMLLFSGTYLHSAVFVFGLSYLCACKNSLLSST